MRVDRLQKLADFLDTVPKQYFSMSTWGDSNAGKLKPQNNFQDCGTRACAMGWALAMPEFNLEGLKWTFTSFGGWEPSLNGNTRNIVQAGAEFFDIPLADAQKLFLNIQTGNHYTTAKEEATFIRNYIKSKPECVEAFNEQANSEPAGSD